MGHRFNVGDEVVIKFGTFEGREGVVMQVQPALVYRIEVAGVDRPLFFSELSLVSADERLEHLTQRPGGMVPNWMASLSSSSRRRGLRRPTP